MTKEELQKEFEATGYSSWINSDLYFDGKIYTKEYTQWLEKKVIENVTENARLREALDEEKKNTKKLTRGISLCLAAINGGLDGLELDNTCDVTENSFIIQQLKDQSEILTQALTENLTGNK